MNMNSKQPKLRQTKQEKFLMEEHQKRIEAKNGRISHIGSKQERSKNQFDPVAHPVYLFRNEKNKKDVCMDYMMT